MTVASMIEHEINGTAPLVESLIADDINTPELTMVSVDEMQAWQGGITPSIFTNFDGNKFFNGYGATDITTIDYWALRQKSLSLFSTNLYGRGIIRRYVTNVINTGLTVESIIDESVLGLSDDAAADWTENVESRFNLWATNPKLCDYKQRVDGSFGEIQAEAYQSALVGGDVLVVLRRSSRFNLPQVQLIAGEAIINPSVIPKGKRIIHGVELDDKERHVAYWVRQADNSVIRMPAIGSRTGRRLAFLMYGTDKRMDEVRGQPLLALILQSVKEIDRYRDSVQRKALIQSYLAMFIKKTLPVLGTAPMTAATLRVDQATVPGSMPNISDGTGSRTLPVGQFNPGIVIEELAPGEEPVAFDSASGNLDFGPFESSILSGMAWALEMPPEILVLAFQNNYSASQAAINEYKMFLNRTRSRVGRGFCQPAFVEWLTAEVASGKVTAARYIESLSNPRLYDIESAWILTDWTGAIKPSTDIKKQAQGNKIMVDEMWMTNARSSRELTGTKYSRNVKIIKRENELKAEALRPILELEKEFGLNQTRDAESQLTAMMSRIDDIEEGQQNGQ